MAANFRQFGLDALLDEADRIDADIQRTFGALSATQLNWKPDASEWGVGQCFDHLIIATSAYFPMLRAILAGTKPSTIWERLPVLPGFWANTLLSMLEPDGSRKATAPPAWKPSTSTIDAGIVASFLACHRECVELMRASRSIDLNIVIASPAAGFITYCLIDAYRIIITHDRLHLGQAERVMALPGFPLTGSYPQPVIRHS